jgi:glutamate/aspartate transport system substrate-binding protein
MTAWRRQGEIDIPQPNGGNAMQRNLIRLLAAALAVAGVTAAAAQEIDSVVKKLQATNSITVGYRETLLPTSYLDDQKRPTGYAIEMCMRILDEVKAELKLPQIKVDYVPVNIQNRQALVANGTVQLECGGTVNTFARNKQVDFSPVSYVAASQLLVLKSSHIAKFEDLNGKIVAVATGGSSEPELKHIIETNKLNVRVINVDDHAAGLIAVESRRADAYFNDNAAFFSLIKQSKNGANLAVVGPEYGYSPQGFMVPKNNPTFLWIVHHAMGKMFKSGEAEKIYDKWFGPFGSKVSPKLRAAWETASYPE